MKHKSILEQALLQIETLEEAVQHNAKGIAMYTVKQELGNVLKESEKEEELEQSPELDDEEKIDDEPVDDEGVETPEETEDAPSDDVPSDEETGDDLVPPIDDPANDMTDDNSENFDDLENEEPEDETLDMTGASDSEVLKVFKAMGPNDGVVVKKENNSIELEDGDNSYVIKLNEQFDEDFADFAPHDPEDETKDEIDRFISTLKPSPKPSNLDKEEEGDFSDESIESEIPDTEIYEIELDGEDDETPPVEGEFTEAARTKWNPHGNKNGKNRSGIPSKKIFKAGSEINEEVTKLRKQNDDLKKALGLFKEKLNEIAVFNANLAYSTQLFTEHSTTKQEKLNILKRFDSVSTLTESKTLFSTIKNELTNRKPITETVVDKISSTPTSSSKDVLSESEAYVNPQFRRIKDLMSKL